MVLTHQIGRKAMTGRVKELFLLCVVASNQEEKCKEKKKKLRGAKIMIQHGGA